ncbi:MAG: hypothetical protein Q7U93_03805 [Nitrosomonas sp.]|nr:hypothetical protein [Nitrosomonas sp.]
MQTMTCTTQQKIYSIGCDTFEKISPQAIITRHDPITDSTALRYLIYFLLTTLLRMWLL